MDVKNLIEGYQAELEKVTNKDQAKEVAGKIIQSFLALSTTDGQSLAQSLYGDISTRDLQITDLNNQITVLKDEISALKKDLEGAEQIAKDAIDQFNEAVPRASKPLTLKLKDKGNVQVNHGVNYKGIDYPAADLVENPTIVAELLEMGSSAVNLIEGK
jgi:hypothetical protein